MQWSPDILQHAFSLSVDCNGENLLDGLEPMRETDDAVAWRSFTLLINDVGLIFMAQAKSNDPIVEFWVMAVFGGTWTNKPRIEVPEGLGLSVSFGGMHRYWDIFSPGWAGHGQGRMFSWSADFATLTLPETYSRPEMESSDYAPAFPRQTGGDWPYMGLWHDFDALGLDPKWELYPLAAQPGHFITTKGDSPSKDIYSHLVLHDDGWFHPLSDGVSWIKHTDPANPWKDRHRSDQNGKGWNLPDLQHYCVDDALCQAAIQFPDDLGLRLLVEFAISRYYVQCPADDRGPSHHNPGTARARGRILKAGSNLVAAAKFLGIDLHYDLVQHVRDLLDLQVVEWKRAEEHGEPTLVLGGKAGEAPHYKPQEHGIWFSGLWSVLKTIPLPDEEPLNKMLSTLSDYILSQFHEYPGAAPGETFWDVPYRDYPTNPVFQPPGGGHFCIPAIQWLSGKLDPADARVAKVNSILAQWIPGLEDRWKLPV